MITGELRRFMKTEEARASLPSAKSRIVRKMHSIKDEITVSRDTRHKGQVTEQCLAQQLIKIFREEKKLNGLLERYRSGVNEGCTMRHEWAERKEREREAKKRER